MSLSEEEEREVLECLRSGWITTGPRVAQFERAFAERLRIADAVSTSSGTAALHLALMALELGPGDEVLTPSLTWPSLPNLVALLGGVPVFCEVDPETLCLDPRDAARKVTPRTRVIAPVHFAGRPADLDAIHALAREHSLTVLEDACHAVGASHRGVPIGAGSPLCAFSFHPNKNLTTGEGGMLTGTDADRLRRARLLRFHGVSRDTFARLGTGQLPHYESVMPGLKYNLTDLQAALGIHQLRKLSGFNKERAALARAYRERLGHLGERLWLPGAATEEGTEHAWHLFTVRVSDREGLRERVMQGLLDEGIQTGLHYLPVHGMRGLRGRARGGSLPVTERIGRTILSLPLFPGMAPRDIERVAVALEKHLD